MEIGTIEISNDLIADIKSLISNCRYTLAEEANTKIIMLYWNVGRYINESATQQDDIEQSKLTLKELARILNAEYGGHFTLHTLMKMSRFHETFPGSLAEIVAAQLSWGHVIELLPLKYSAEREFYVYMTITQKWDPLELKDNIQKMLHGSTIGFQSLKGHYLEVLNTASQDNGPLDLGSVMRDHYVLDFLGLPSEYSETEQAYALLSNLERTLLSKHSGFSLVSRQRRMTIKDTHYWVDLVFYHRALKRVIAFDIKMHTPPNSFKQQMTLYLHWLKKYEYFDEENAPVGIVVYVNHNSVDIEVCDIAGGNQDIAESINKILPLNYLKGALQSFLAGEQGV